MDNEIIKNSGEECGVSVGDGEGEPQIENWDDLNLKEDILRGIFSYGYEKPSDIQKKSIPNIIR